mgnify:CR=1 FL=1|tara:strand:- start:628 stop:1068 length:441 start_codon:yes stop_codon:yes gene_type:complete
MDTNKKKLNIVTKEEKFDKVGLVSDKRLLKIILIAILLTVLETTGQSLLRKFYLLNRDNKTDNFKYIWLPFITWFIYGIAVLLLYISYGFGNISLIEVMWNTGTNTIVPLAGVIFFGENLSKYGWLGVIVTTIGGIILGLAQTGTI